MTTTLRLVRPPLRDVIPPPNVSMRIALDRDGFTEYNRAVIALPRVVVMELPASPSVISRFTRWLRGGEGR